MQVFVCLYDQEGTLQILAGAHVDDVFWAANPEYEYIMIDDLLGNFKLNGIKEHDFRFCGREYTQSEDYSAYVTCKNNTEKILPINFEVKNRGGDEKATERLLRQDR